MSSQITIEKALSYFDEGYACSQAVLLAFADCFNLDEQTAKLISSTFGGGMGRLREKCGAVTGGFMVLGLQYGNDNPKDMDTKLNAYRLVRHLDKEVTAIHGSSNCSAILKKFASEAEVADRKHHKIICRKVVGDVTRLVYEMLENQPISE